MGAFLVLAAAAFLIYAMVIEPRRIATIIESRLASGDQFPGLFSCQKIVELLQAAAWIRDKKEVKLSDPGEDDHSGLIEVVCKGVTYQVRITPCGDNASKLTISAVFKSGSWDIEKVRRLQEANRIRCRIMERANPGFTEQSQQYYGAIKTMCLLRYCAIALIAAFLCYVAVPQILNWILGEGSVQEIHVLGMMIVVILFIYSGVALSPYITETRSEKLLDGVSVPQYWSNEDLMDLLRDMLRIRTMQSLYFDEAGRVAIKGKHATYLIEISSECPRLSVAIQGGADAAAYQEADYIQCSVAKLFSSTYPENPEKTYQMLAAVHRSHLLSGISIVAFIVLLAAPFLLNYFGSKGIANSYLTQYSETVTVGEAFEGFFANPKWKSYKDGGQEYVDFTGGCTYLGEKATMRITFAVFDDTFNVSNIAINGIDMPWLSWPEFLETIYSGTESSLPASNGTADVPRPETTFTAEPEPSQAPPAKAGAFDNFIGTWQDEYGYGSYLFIGYADESKSVAYVLVATAAGEFEAELASVSDEYVNGIVMGGGSEPLYAIDINRYNHWLETTVYFGESGFSEDIKFIPADPATCPYENTYYTG